MQQKVTKMRGKKKEEHILGEFEFFYQGWKNSGTQFRSGATKENLFPENRKGKLSFGMLSRLGLSKQ